MKLVTSPDELLQLPRDRRVNGYGPRQPVRLAIAGLPQHQLLRVQARFDRLQRRCGCLAGGFAALACLILAAVVLAQDPRAGLSWAWGLRILQWLGGAFAAGLVAKLLTLVLTRWEFAWLCRRQYGRLVRRPGSRVAA